MDYEKNLKQKALDDLQEEPDTSGKKIRLEQNEQNQEEESKSLSEHLDFRRSKHLKNITILHLCYICLGGMNRRICT